MAKLSKSDLDDLKAAGYVEGRPETIPDNVSPVIKSQLLEEWRKKEGAGALDMPTGVERGNELARERAAADGDEVMQKRFEESKDKKADPLDHDNNGVKGGTKGRQNDAANK
jgi:hypothetical protein